MRVPCIALLLLSTSAFAQGTSDAPGAKATIRDAQGKTIGTATLAAAPNGVVVRVVLAGAPAGTHAIHLHDTGVCDAPFASAGGHFNPAAKQHGMLSPMGMHAGDLPNITVPADGALTLDAFVRDVTLGSEANGLFKNGGTAIVLHAAADDYATNPAGNAGARIACGVIVR